ncbi:YlmC/YmxH family sporulation protein [Desulforamulus aquiferis]|uniref:YlmC/YmxH family sporulation protein n=1 Tax=Desulforamulus aquiferis TaxID=1397668 RepID=A0AAW7ZCR6_9FIRM|nr:YlmC/YmxH family sporulation protein [Desulforamulus aquiferis]MDO7787478.1 YlmC/YmxH family sporulation protein [Desulforamulus aquiferis]RYD06794.1 YlmC/YmxH family sporulation protein [Desulforamulus aquiferis]
MRLGELVGKEIVNINNGARLGVVGESDVTLDIETGTICSIILPRRSNFINMWVDKQQMIIPWDAIRKIGEEVIIVEMDQGNPLFQKYSY